MQEPGGDLGRGRVGFGRLQRRLAILALGPRVGPLGQQQFQYRDAAGEGGRMQRAGPVAVLAVDVGLGGDQQRGDLGVTVKCRPGEDRDPQVRILDIRVTGRLGQQRLDRGHVLLANRRGQFLAPGSVLEQLGTLGAAGLDLADVDLDFQEPGNKLGGSGFDRRRGQGIFALVVLELGIAATVEQQLTDIRSTQECRCRERPAAIPALAIGISTRGQQHPGDLDIPDQRRPTQRCRSGLGILPVGFGLVGQGLFDRSDVLLADGSDQFHATGSRCLGPTLLKQLDDLRPALFDGFLVNLHLQQPGDDRHKRRRHLGREQRCLALGVPGIGIALFGDQQFDHSGSAKEGSDMQRGGPISVLPVDVGTPFDQQPRDLDIPDRRRPRKRSHSHLPVRGIRIHLVIQRRLDGREILTADSGVQSTAAVLAAPLGEQLAGLGPAGFDAGPVQGDLQQVSDELGCPPVGSQGIHRCFAVVVLDVGVGSLFEQQLDNVTSTEEGRRVQRAISVPVFHSDLRSLLDQQRHDLPVTVNSRSIQDRCPVGILGIRIGTGSQVLLDSLDIPGAYSRRIVDSRRRGGLGGSSLRLGRSRVSGSRRVPTATAGHQCRQPNQERQNSAHQSISQKTVGNRNRPPTGRISNRTTLRKRSSGQTPDTDFRNFLSGTISAPRYFPASNLPRLSFLLTMVVVFCPAV